jgi:hypothetical protein
MGGKMPVLTPSHASGALGTTLEILAAGIVATLATDLWNLLLHIVVGHSLAQWGLIGRWVAWMPRGVFTHRAITASPHVRGETAIGWVFHYVVGIAYAALYLAIMRLVLGSGPTIVSALIFAIMLLVAPWFIMQPALGFGFAAARFPHPGAVRAVNASTHAIFGLGLYLGAASSLLIAS